MAMHAFIKRRESPFHFALMQIRADWVSSAQIYTLDIFSN